MNIKSLPKRDRPMEKLIYGGASSLSSAELLALIIRTGTVDKSAVGLAEEVLSYVNREIGSLGRAEVGELTRIEGIGLAKACSIVASMELAKRYQSDVGYQSKLKLDNVSAAAEMIMRDLQYEKREHVVAILLDSKCQIEAKVTVSIGALDTSSIHPREVFSPAIRRGAAAIIIAHNHPSGDPSPSEEDIDVTYRIMHAGQMLGIEVIDHIIVGDGRYFSMREAGYFNSYCIGEVIDLE
ncbi:MAG: DNA repair protein RadC [Mogibacterium sp.]|nr:DNA repair protein RadC [Mogibacterium sp.]